jgi:hypothetical protein
LAEVAEVGEAETVERKAEDRVRATLRACDGIVLGGDPDHLADRRLVRPRCAEHPRRAADDLDGVMVEVIVRHEHEISNDIGDRRVAELEPAGGEGPGVAEDALLTRE